MTKPTIGLRLCECTTATRQGQLSRASMFSPRTAQLLTPHPMTKAARSCAVSIGRLASPLEFCSSATTHCIAAGCGLRAILEDQPDFEIAGEAQDCQQAQRCVPAVNAHVALLHLRGHSINQAAIRVMTGWAVESSVRVLVLTSSCSEPADEVAALRAGAGGLLHNTASPAELAAAVRLVAAGYRLCTQSIIDKLGAAQQTGLAPGPVPTEFQDLTTRERQVFHLMAAGSGNAEIAAALTLGESTIKSHVQHILTKLALPNRLHAVIFAHKHGLVTARDQ
ncbi:MAG: response regulator transcription factor [Pseudonocardiaceae bacterium]